MECTVDISLNGPIYYRLIVLEEEKKDSVKVSKWLQ